VSVADYPSFLMSFSLYRMLKPAADAVLADSAAAIEQHGGVLDFAMVTDLVLAPASLTAADPPNGQVRQTREAVRRTPDSREHAPRHDS
jgi:hypothetical protein